MVAGIHPIRVTCSTRQITPANGRPMVKKVNHGSRNAMRSLKGESFLQISFFLPDAGKLRGLMHLWQSLRNYGGIGEIQGFFGFASEGRILPSE
jgi:hypothetical protein